MENYFTFNKKVLASYGITFEGGDKKFGSLHKLTVLTLLLVTTFQSFMFLVFAGEINIGSANATIISFHDLQGTVKFITVLASFKKLKKISENLSQLMGNLSPEEKKLHKKALERFSKVTKSILIFTITCCWLFNILPLIVFFYYFITKGTFSKATPLFLWYPFNNVETLVRFFSTSLYESISCHVLATVPVAMDGFVMLMIGQLIILFRCLGENFVKIVNDSKNSPRTVTVQNINHTIDLHNRLYDLSSALFEIYSVPLLLNVVTEASQICFICFLILVSIKFRSAKTFYLVVPYLDSRNGSGYTCYLWFDDQSVTNFYALLVW